MSILKIYLQIKTITFFLSQAASSNWMEFDPKESDQRSFDVTFELETPGRVMIGQGVTIPVVITNLSEEPRTIQSNICTRFDITIFNSSIYLLLFRSL